MTAALKLRVTAIKCPCCNGTGQFSSAPPLDKMACQWCKGQKRMLVADAKRYAYNVFMLAGGGYIAGDHSYDDMRRMETKAEAIYEAIGEVPSWKRKPVEKVEKPCGEQG